MPSASAWLWRMSTQRSCSPPITNAGAVMDGSMAVRSTTLSRSSWAAEPLATASLAMPSIMSTIGSSIARPSAVKPSAIA